MVLEVMGRYAGWIATLCRSGGGADVILIPEIPFSYESVCAKVQERGRPGGGFRLSSSPKGAREKGADFVTSGQAGQGEARLGGIGAIVGQRD